MPWEEMLIPLLAAAVAGLTAALLRRRSRQEEGELRELARRMETV